MGLKGCSRPVPIKALTWEDVSLGDDGSWDPRDGVAMFRVP